MINNHEHESSSLSQPPGLTFGFKKSDDVALTDRSLDVADDAAVVVVQKLDTDLCTLTLRASAADDLCHFGVFNSRGRIPVMTRSAIKIKYQQEDFRWQTTIFYPHDRICIYTLSKHFPMRDQMMCSDSLLRIVPPTDSFCAHKYDALLVSDLHSLLGSGQTFHHGHALRFRCASHPLV